MYDRNYHTSNLVSAFSTHPINPARNHCSTRLQNQNHNQQTTNPSRPLYASNDRIPLDIYRRHHNQPGNSRRIQPGIILLIQIRQSTIRRRTIIITVPVCLRLLRLPLPCRNCNPGTPHYQLHYQEKRNRSTRFCTRCINRLCIPGCTVSSIFNSSNN